MLKIAVVITMVVLGCAAPAFALDWTAVDCPTYKRLLAIGSVVLSDILTHPPAADESDAIFAAWSDQWARHYLGHRELLRLAQGACANQPAYLKELQREEKDWDAKDRANAKRGILVVELLAPAPPLRMLREAPRGADQ